MSPESLVVTAKTAIHAETLERASRHFAGLTRRGGDGMVAAMKPGFRRAALHFALVAMLLRALLPAGWMPGQAANGQSLLVICSVTAPADRAHQDQHQAPAGQHAHEECPFAAAPHVAPPALAAAFTHPATFARFANPPASRDAVLATAAYQPQSPRAPPLNA
jgi:hypothetical protein